MQNFAGDRRINARKRVEACDVGGGDRPGVHTGQLLDAQPRPMHGQSGQVISVIPVSQILEHQNEIR
jgi:hypothetical protein